jgi:hypothetical protein
VFANPLFQLDLEDSTYEPLARHLLARQAPALEPLPFTDTIASAVGCKVLEWRDSIVSLTCFRSDTGELVHLFIGQRGRLDEGLLQHGPHRAQVGAFSSVTWLRGNVVVMVASKLPAEQLERTLRAGLAMVDARPSWRS